MGLADLVLARPRRDVEPGEPTVVDDKMIEALGVVSDAELRDPTVHAGICSLRFKLLAAIGVELNQLVRAAIKQSRSNADTLRSLVRVVSLMVFALGALGVIELFGRDRGAEFLVWIVGHL